jgi:hypothetical protein
VIMNSPLRSIAEIGCREVNGGALACQPWSRRGSARPAGEGWRPGRRRDRAGDSSWWSGVCSLPSIGPRRCGTKVSLRCECRRTSGGRCGACRGANSGHMVRSAVLCCLMLVVRVSTYFSHHGTAYWVWSPR